MINYKKRFTLHREFYPSSNIETSIESDRGRILSSPALRRLQKRTQVFALELNASIRTRLTHSMEVGQNARFIAKTILDKLKKEKGLESYGLEELENAFISTAEMTSLLHDIGNPPFGHFAEQTINAWAKNNLANILDSFSSTTKENQKLKEELIRDICDYDGNAQAIRVITKLQRLNLSYSQILSVLKYTRGAYEIKDSNDKLNYLKKKPGFYYSEKDLIEKIQDTLEVKRGHRFPVTYIMEAADDISYLTADLEDSVEKGILSLEEIYNLIIKECEKQGETYLKEILNKQYEKAKKDDEPYQFNMFFTLVRSKLVTALVAHVSNVFISNHKEVFEGSFNSALLDYDENSEFHKSIKVIEKVSQKYIYQNKEVQTLELKGYTIINTLLEKYKPLLLLSSEDFSKLLKDKKIDCFISMRLIKRISSKQIVAYKHDVEKLDIKENEKYDLLEWYFRARLIIDYISGMTDDYALEEYRLLSALK
jgi:dGTPase